MTRPTVEAAEELAEEGIDAEVIDLRTLSPMDTDAIVESFKKTGRATVVHEAPRPVGWPARLSPPFRRKSCCIRRPPLRG